MRVYELMDKLAKCPSGAKVRCSALLTVPELESSEECGQDEFGDNMYPVDKVLDSVENEDEIVYLNF